MALGNVEVAEVVLFLFHRILESSDRLIVAAELSEIASLLRQGFTNRTGSCRDDVIEVAQLQAKARARLNTWRDR